MTKLLKRKIYLEDKPRAVALKQLLDAFKIERDIEVLPTSEAGGRITAQPVYAHLSMPHFHASAMDGIAIAAERTYGAHEKKPLTLVEHVDFEYVDTGDPIPEPYNAVIMIEHIQDLGDGEIEIIEPAAPWQHIRPVGEDVVSGEMLFPQGHRLRPVDLGALLAGGILTVPVVKKPTVAIIPTGDELVVPKEKLERGDIIEFNGTVFSQYVEEWGGHPIYKGITKDNPDAIKKAILDGVESADIVIINAGSSAGSEDYTVHMIQELGEVYTHGVATRPGKPVVLGKVKGKIVIGLPGYPVSAYLTMEWFVQPLICHYLGIAVPKRETLKVKLGRRIVSTMGSEDFIRLNIGFVNEQYIANPLNRGAGITMSLVRADGLLVVPSQSQGYEQGEEVEVELYKPLDEIKHSILFSGSHDLSIDIISSLLKRNDFSRQIISSHTGSMAGIMAIKKGEAHVAGIHLLHSESGEYNTPYVKQYLKQEDVVLIKFLQREQGWIVPNGNPKNITSINDIIEKDILYVNRQRGAGTRILFDFLLEKSSLSINDINGYSREMYSHLSIAAAVKNGSADTGLGVYAAARALQLDFIPVAYESYDLVMTTAFYESTAGQILLETIKSKQFKEELEKLGGYKVENIGLPIFL